MIRNPVFSRRGPLLGVLASLAAVGLAVPTTAAAKVTSLTSCQAITVPGKYRLDADPTTILPDGDCFDISTSGVRLNLNGHTLAGVPSGFGIFVPKGAANVNVVGPGTLTGWETGIAGPGDNGSVRGVTATNNNFGIAISNFVTGVSIRGNVATSNTSIGIAVGGGSTDNTIIGNFAHQNGESDLADGNNNCDSNVWRGNDFGTADPSSCIH